MKEHRARLGLKQEDLARLVGVRRETIGNLEKGRYNPSLVLAWNIAQALTGYERPAGMIPAGRSVFYLPAS